MKALTINNDTGADVAPPEYVNELIKTITEISPLRTIASGEQQAKKYSDMQAVLQHSIASWVTEVGTKSETTGYTHLVEEIPTHGLVCSSGYSNQMLEDLCSALEQMQRRVCNTTCKE